MKVKKTNLLFLIVFFLLSNCSFGNKNIILTSNNQVETKYFTNNNPIENKYFIDSKSLIENLIIN